MFSSQNVDQQKLIIEKYASQCRVFNRDLDHIVHDNSSKDKTIRYAVDFSEIYAYMFPTKTASEFCLFEDEPIESVNILQQDALSQLFFCGEKVILLNSYAIEWDTALAHLSQKQIDSFSRAPKEKNKIFEDPTIQCLSRKSVKSEELTDNEREWLWKYLKEHATSLLELFLSQDANALERMQQLLNKKRFENIKDLLGEELIIDLDDETNKQRSEKLRQNRQDRRKNETDDSSIVATYLDAVAMTTVEQANKILQAQNKNINLLLVTRSEAMNRLLEEEQKDQDNMSFFLRHPRVFIDFFNKKHLSSTEDEKLNKAKEYSFTVKAFLESVDRALLKLEKSKRELGNWDWDKLENEFNKITEIWQEWTIVGALTKVTNNDRAISSENVALSRPHRNDEVAYHILRLCGNDQEFKKMQRENIERIASSWKIIHEEFGVLIQGYTSSNEGRINLEPITGKGTYALQTKPISHYFSLHFYSEEVQKYIDHINILEQVGWWDVINAFEDFENKDNLNLDANYERLLAMAFILGAMLGEWRLALTYCELAIDTAEAQKEKMNILPSEALYFKAICLRKSEPPPSSDDHQKAIELLEEAIILRRSIMLTPKESARYLHEQGLHILILNSKDKNIKSDYSSDKGLKLLEDAENLSQGDRKLKIQIYNNRLYHYITQKRENRKEIKQDYEFLKKLLQEEKESPSQYPALILHTLVEACLLLYGGADIPKKFIQILEEKVSTKSKELSKSEIKDIKNTLEKYHESEKQ